MILTIAIVLFFCPSCAQALKVIESNGFYIYFPEEENPLAERIVSRCAPITNFLKEQDIPVSKPIHIIIDKNLDQPKPLIQLFPHREIRLPIRAPGVFEDGYTESDPWKYYLFKGLSALGIFNMRSGLPAGAYRLFGEVISPNTILPDWTIDGFSHLLYELYSLHRVSDPIAQAILTTSGIASIDHVSHHPEVWPGQFSYRIYGRPFTRWLYERLGWKRMLLFLQLHGKGIMPIEIDFKAKRAFGMTWNQLWQSFKDENLPTLKTEYNRGIPIVGYWNMPFYYWNDTGIYPGVQQNATRSRYGYLDQDNWLWISEYAEGISKIKMQRHGAIHQIAKDHVWDPGPGSVAVTRHGSAPALILFGPRNINEEASIKREIKGPAGALQISGPVMDSRGRIAVSAVIEGNWDIWLYDTNWHRVTNSPSIEIDPCFIDGKLIFASNSTGRFQIHGAGRSGMIQLTQTSTAAVLPRNNTYLELDGTGWRRNTLDKKRIPILPKNFSKSLKVKQKKVKPKKHLKNYSAWKSIWPNYIVPDYFFNIDDFQLGLATNAADVSRAYTWNAGFRYDIDDKHITWRLGYHAKQLRGRVVRYPLKYTTRRKTNVNEMRLEVNLSWSPRKLKQLTLSTNWLRFAPRNAISNEEWWASLSWKDQINSIRTEMNFDAFEDSSKSVYGDLSYKVGEKVNTIIHVQGGKTWGPLTPGHNTFRIGGNSGEGYFTQRFSRLFSLRGFDSNVLDAGQAASVSIDVQWPFAKLQAGYKTLPLFFHNVTLGTFIDAGFAASQFEADEILVSAGIELITGMQLAWDSKSNFSIGLGWPLKKPSDVEQNGPLLLILIGLPL